MDKLSAFYDHIAERLRSPLIFSFIISWMIINWRILVYLLWFDESTLMAHGYQNHILYIQGVLGHWQGWIWPLIFAMAYTILFPQIKNLISWYQAWTSKVGEKKRLEIAEGSVIPFEKYDAKVKKLIQRERELAEMVKSEGETIAKYTEANTNLQQQILTLKERIGKFDDEKGALSKDLLENSKEILALSSSTKSEVFNGIWSVQMDKVVVEWKFEGGFINELDSSNSFTSQHSVEFSFWSPKRDGRIVLMIHLLGGVGPWSNYFPNNRIYCLLRSNTEGTILTGLTENGYQLTLRRIS